MSDNMIIGLIIYNAVVSTATLGWMGRGVWARLQVKRELKNYKPLPVESQVGKAKSENRVKIAEEGINMGTFRATPKYPDDAKAPVKPTRPMSAGALRERLEAESRLEA